MTKRKRKSLHIEVVKDMPAGDLIVVAGPVNYFADNLSAACSECGATVYYRPAAAGAAGYICHRCWQAKYAGERIVASEDSIREVALFIASTKGKQ